ncbi:MAG: hypothetical protein HOM37_14365 [Acidimicrobiaceae bacterium]|nr:hypothetical protein [Acidimicrobiaceae bacterium]
MSLQVEFDFTLPKGFIDDNGALHRDGVMRLATARDEIEPLRDQRIAGPDDPYLTLVILGRVIVRMGTITDFTPRHVEALFAADLAYLQDLYGIVNFGDPSEIEALRAATAAERVAPEPASPAAAEPEPEPEPELELKEATSPPRVRTRVEEVPRGTQP